MEEKKEEAVEYRDTVNLTYISNITQLERQLQAIEMSYMTDKGVLEPLDAVVLSNGAGVGVVGGGNGAVVGVLDDRDVIEDGPQKPGISRLKSVTRGVYRMVKSDVGLVLLLVCYMTMGAAIFTAIEEKSPEEMEQAELVELRRILADIRRRIDSPNIDHSPEDTALLLDVGTGGNTTTGPTEGNATSASEYGDLAVGKDIQKQLVDALVRCHEYHEGEEGRKPSPKKQMLWTFSGAMYFCVTVFTTVGYGNIVPTTDRSRVVTMIYAALGIPLCLVVLSQVGKSLTRLIKFLWSFVRRFYYTGSCQRVRRMIPLSRFRRSLFQRVSDHVRQSTTRLTSRSRGLSSSTSRGAGSPSDDRQGLNEIYIPYEVDDKFNLPPVVAITIAFLYIFLGAFLYTRWENWTYMEAFYFTFISICTIGFGDVVPDHPKFFLASSVYLLLGLALAAMVINVIMEAVTDTITKATDTVRHVRRRIVQIAPHAHCYAAPPRESLDLTSRRRSV